MTRDKRNLVYLLRLVVLNNYRIFREKNNSDIPLCLKSYEKQLHIENLDAIIVDCTINKVLQIVDIGVIIWFSEAATAKMFKLYKLQRMDNCPK